jgi:hypothetical protein
MKTLREVFTGKDDLELQRNDRETEKQGIEKEYFLKSMKHMDNEPWRNLLFTIIGAASTLFATLLVSQNDAVQSELKSVRQEYKSTLIELENFRIELQELKQHVRQTTEIDTTKN